MAFVGKEVFLSVAFGAIHPVANTLDLPGERAFKKLLCLAQFKLLLQTLKLQVLTSHFSEINDLFNVH